MAMGTALTIFPDRSIARRKGADDDRRQMLRVYIGARHAPYIVDGDGADQFRVAFEIIESQSIRFGIGEKVGDLQVLLKVEDETAGEIVSGDVDFVARHRLFD